MKKQLIALSAMFVVFAAQASYFERAKAYAKEKYAQYMPQAKEFYNKYVKQYVPTFQEYVQKNVLPVGQEFVTSKLLSEDVTDLFKGVPYGSPALDQARTMYMNKFYPEFKKQLTTDEDGNQITQWVKP